MDTSFGWFPPAASTLAWRVDTLFLGVLLVTGFAGTAVITLMLYFCVKYRSGSHADRSHPPSNKLPLEIAWTIFPLLAFLAMFVWAAYDYTAYYSPPAEAMPVFVVAKQWMWKLQHANGRREIDELHVPLGRPVRVIMTSQDVIHSFFVPAFRVKQDVVPGRYTSVWFTPTQLGEFPLFCAEYCGAQHAAMHARVIVMPPAQFAHWLEQGTPRALAAHGYDLFRQYGCSGCHDARSSVHAPDLTGLIGRVVHLQDGRTLVADENYVRDSILLPRKDIVAGFAPIMPSFAGQVSEEDIEALIEYIR
ncbi:MAG TPA: cytochrome c oxidase subunit II, partial [Burkholderiales bacterium]|nr:cytochrome c oxidase subunit II [Burkholderiales bacterium]